MNPARQATAQRASDPAFPLDTDVILGPGPQDQPAREEGTA
jgi:hypothetical protein